MILDNVRYHYARRIKKWLEANFSVFELQFRAEANLKDAVFKRFNRIQGNLAPIRELTKPNLLETEQWAFA